MSLVILLSRETEADGEAEEEVVQDEEARSAIVK